MCARFDLPFGLRRELAGELADELAWVDLREMPIEHRWPIYHDRREQPLVLRVGGVCRRRTDVEADGTHGGKSFLPA